MVFNSSDAVTACAADGKAAFRLMARIEKPDTTFEELGVDLIPPKLQRLAAKIRHAVTKHMAGGEKEKNKKLVSHLEKRRQEMARKAEPEQISGPQLIWLIKHYYMIHDTERVQYELSSLMDLTYPGDAQLSWWKDHVDHMLRNLVTPLADRDQFGILSKKLKGSDRLKATFEHLERIPEGDSQRTWQWLSGHIDKLIVDDRKRQNTESLVLAASGKEQPQGGKAGSSRSSCRSSSRSRHSSSSSSWSHSEGGQRQGQG